MTVEYPYPYLVDAPLDGGVEDHGHLPLHAAATAEEAAREFARRYEGGDDKPPVFTCAGRQELLKPVVRSWDGDPDRAPTADELNDLDFSFDCIQFVKAGSVEEPFAQVWWVVEALPRCDRYDEEGDFYCTRPDGHDGSHSEAEIVTV